ncbi:MAG: dihydroorotase, partial [Acidimicrobiia bacterium]
RIAGLEEHGRWPEIGRQANLVVFDPRESWTPTRFASKSQNSPWLGRVLEGRTRATIRRGVLTYEQAR